MFIREKQVMKIYPSFHVTELSKSLWYFLSQIFFKFSVITIEKSRQKEWKGLLEILVFSNDTDRLESLT